MYPVLLNIGNLQVSTFGLLLAIGIFLGGFSVWRIARGYELESENILDLSFLTIGIGFLSARLIFVLTNLTTFDSFSKIFFLNRYPGLSFWGGIIGGLLALIWLARKNKISFLMAGDFAMVGFLLAAFFAEIGCLLGSCGVGVETSQFFGVTQVGVIGKRFPIQFFEAIIFLVSFLAFWKTSIKFHVEGSLLAKGLMLVSVTKLIALFFKSQVTQFHIFNLTINLELIATLVLLGIGIRLYYSVYKKTPLDDLRQIWRFFSDRKTQSQFIAKLSKGWYNHWVNLWISLGKGKKRIFKFLKIKPNPESF